MVEDWEIPLLMGSDQVRWVMFMTGLFAFKCGWLVWASLSRGGVLILNQNRMVSFSRQDGHSVGPDGKCD